MEMTKNEIIEKVLGNDKMLNSNIIYAQDKSGDEFLICDSHEEMSEVIDLFNEVADTDFDSDWDIEKEFGVTLVFSDEYTTCSDCSKLIRTSPDSYFWQPDFHIGDGFIACNECFNDNEDMQEDYLQERVNNYQSANQLLSDEQIEALDFKRISEHEYFMGERTTDTPERLYHALEEQYHEILFSIDSTGQFNTDYSVWVRGEK